MDVNGQSREFYYGFENARLGVDLYSAKEFTTEQLEAYRAGYREGAKATASSDDVDRARNILEQFDVNAMRREAMEAGE